MYNTRSSSSGNNSNQYKKVKTFQQPQQQQQQIMPHVVTFVTPPQMQHQESKSPIQCASSTQLPPLQSHCSQPLIQTPEHDNENKILKVDDIESVEEQNMERMEVKWPSKRKLNKKEQKKRLNARVKRLVCPKSPLMVFTELYKDVPIKLEENTLNSCIVYIASFEIDGDIYFGEHVSKTQAKQQACEKYLRVMLAKKINEFNLPDKKEELSEKDVENGENSMLVKHKGPPQEDFPWPHFASLAMHNLINHWELQPVVKGLKEDSNIKTPKKAVGMKKFPDNPSEYNPVQLLHHMSPGIKFNETVISHNNPSCFQAKCEMNGVEFTGKGKTKKAAKRECAIATIKYYWHYDFNEPDKTKEFNVRDYN